MSPELSAESLFVEFGDTNAGGIRYGMFGENIHGDFGKKKISADTGSGGDAGVLVNVADHLGDEFGGSGFGVFEIASEFAKNFVD